MSCQSPRTGVIFSAGPIYLGDILGSQKCFPKSPMPTPRKLSTPNHRWNAFLRHPKSVVDLQSYGAGPVPGMKNGWRCLEDRPTETTALPRGRFRSPGPSWVRPNACAGGPPAAPLAGSAQALGRIIGGLDPSVIPNGGSLHVFREGVESIYDCFPPILWVSVCFFFF